MAQHGRRVWCLFNRMDCVGRLTESLTMALHFPRQGMLDSSAS